MVTPRRAHASRNGSPRKALLTINEYHSAGISAALHEGATDVLADTVCQYKVSSKGVSQRRTERVRSKRKSRCSDTLKSIFLPEGYPHSVSPDYVQFQFWDTLQAMCSYLRGMLCTEAILLGVGVGNAQATAVNASVQVLLSLAIALYGRYVRRTDRSMWLSVVGAV